MFLINSLSINDTEYNGHCNVKIERASLDSQD
jgi:hypothetical protein